MFRGCPYIQTHTASVFPASYISRSDRGTKTLTSTEGKMGTKQQPSSDPIADPKKKRRVEFSKTDAGVEANECIKIYLVSTKEEVDSTNSFCLEPVDLNNFFEEDGKIYGYEGLKITVWLSSLSFHAYADISFESKSDRGKGITDLKSSLQNIFAENLLEEKEDLLKTFTPNCNFLNSIVSNAEILQHKVSNDGNDNSDSSKSEPSNLETQVLRVVGSRAGPLYGQLVPLVLLLIDGSNPIDVTDPRWEIYLLIEKQVNAPENVQLKLLGFAAVYRFHRYPDTERLRLGQILVLPPYQRKGYGRFFLEVLNNVAISENVYDLTIEEPVESLQHVRTCIDVQRLLVFDSIKDALKAVVSQLKQDNHSSEGKKCQLGPPPNAVEDVRRDLKINEKQFSQCWEILVYLSLDPVEKYTQIFRSIICGRIKANILGKSSEGIGKHVVDVPTDYDEEMSFVMFKSQNGEPSSIQVDEDQIKQEEQLNQLADERMKEIKLVAEKVSVCHQ